MAIELGLENRKFARSPLVHVECLQLPLVTLQVLTSVVIQRTMSSCLHWGQALSWLLVLKAIASEDLLLLRFYSSLGAAGIRLRCKRGQVLMLKGLPDRRFRGVGGGDSLLRSGSGYVGCGLVILDSKSSVGAVCSLCSSSSNLGVINLGRGAVSVLLASGRGGPAVVWSTGHAARLSAWTSASRGGRTAVSAAAPVGAAMASSSPTHVLLQWRLCWVHRSK